MQQFEELKRWYSSLQTRDRRLALTASIALIITLFYLLAWEPVYQGLEQQQQQYHNQLGVLGWMQNAAEEAKALKRSGAKPLASNRQPISLIVEQSADTAGLRKNLSKLESSGTEGVRVTLEAASFDQMLIWLNTLQQQHGVNITSANITRADKTGTVDARLSFSKT